MTSRQIALRIAKAASDSKADDLTILDLRALSSTFDYFVIGSSTSQRRSQAIADEIHTQLRAEGVRLWHQEGQAEGDWVLLDYGSVVAHVFTAELRTFYRLERLWADAPHVTWPAGRTVAATRRRPAARRAVVSR